MEFMLVLHKILKYVLEILAPRIPQP